VRQCILEYSKIIKHLAEKLAYNFNDEICDGCMTTQNTIFDPETDNNSQNNKSIFQCQ